MKRRPVLACALAGLFLAAPGVARAVDENAARERAGVRVGGLVTFDQLNEAYGGGWALTIFLTEQIARPLLLDFRLGALYLGDLQIEDLDDQLTGTPGVQGAMRVLFLTAGPMLGGSLGGGYSMYGSVGLGIYSVSMVFDTGVSAFDFSDQNFGFNGGVGVLRRLSTNWSIDANAAMNYFLVDKNDEDLYYAFTDGDDSPLLLDITVGLTLDLR